jgi:hypothetical protein
MTSSNAVNMPCHEKSVRAPLDSDLASAPPARAPFTTDGARAATPPSSSSSTRSMRTNGFAFSAARRFLRAAREGEEGKLSLASAPLMPRAASS